MTFRDRLVSGISNLVNRATTAARIVGARVFHFGGRTTAGVRIDADSALKTATVWACVQYLTRQVGQVPWRVMREDGQSGKCVLAPTHPADWVLNKRPNPEMGSFAWRQTMLMWVLLRGNAYAEIERDLRGAIVALWQIHPDRVRPRREAGRLVYDVSNEGGAGLVTLEQAEMFHLRGLGDGPVGLSVMEYAAESIGWAQATELFGAAFFGQGMNPSGLIETTKALTGPAMEELRRELKKLYGGPKGEQTAILDAGMKFTKLATQPNDAQFIETRQHQINEICRWFGVPPHKVQHLMDATFSNIESQSIEVVSDLIVPWVKVFEEEADYKIFGAQNRGGFYTKMNLRALLRGDSAARAAFYKELWGMGAYTVNRILELEDENTIGEEGDVRFVPANFMTLERAIEQGHSVVTPAGQQNAPIPAAAPSAPGGDS